MVRSVAVAGAGCYLGRSPCLLVGLQTDLYLHQIYFSLPSFVRIPDRPSDQTHKSAVKTVKPLFYLGGMAVFMPHIHVPVELYTVLLGVLSKQQPAHGPSLPRYAAVKGPPHLPTTHQQVKVAGPGLV